jgi:hypothetical protein
MAREVDHRVTEVWEDTEEEDWSGSSGRKFIEMDAAHPSSLLASAVSLTDPDAPGYQRGRPSVHLGSSSVTLW